MAQQSSIEWTDLTWNPVVGCSIESAGCKNCYAMRMAARLQAMGHEKYESLTKRTKRGAVWTDKVRCHEESVEIPLTWKKSRRVFVNSMSDLFHPDVPSDFVRRIWNVMQRTPQHHYQILTKRPQRMSALLNEIAPVPLRNVWLGTSVEDDRVVERLDHLREVPASVRFISFEPLIGDVGQVDLTDIHWAIVGGESGPRARSMDKEWVESILDQCLDAGTAFFFKQWGGVNKKKAGRDLEGRTWDALPRMAAASL
jgi:protein gp37